MEKNVKQHAYESPVMEAVEVSIESAIAGPSSCIAFECGGVETEPVCPDCGGDEEL